MAENLVIDFKNGGANSPLVIDNSIPGNTEFPPEVNKNMNHYKMITAFGIQALKTVSGAVLSRMGDYTGNRAQQQRINNIRSIIDPLATVAQGALVGASAGGFYGALAGAGVAVGGIALNTTIEVLDYNNQTELENLNRESARQISMLSNNNKREGGNE